MVREWLGLYKKWRGQANKRSDRPSAHCDSISDLCSAARWTQNPARMRSLQRTIHDQLNDAAMARIDWRHVVPDYAERHLGRSVILKPFVGPGEKGVIYISFECEWGKLLGRSNLAEFATKYDLVLAPSGDPHNLINYAFANIWPGTLYSQISNAGDIEVLKGVSEKLIALPLYASSWVNPTWFSPKPKCDRAFDLTMVANFAKFKRHHILFRALRSMPRDLRVLLIGQDQDGRTAKSIEQEARWYGVEDRFLIRVSQPYAQVIQAFSDSRSSVILSRREGLCVVVAESMFADAPVAILQSAELGSRAFINERTGIFLNEQGLAEQLTRFVGEADGFAPKAWAEENISCFKSSARLSRILQQHAEACGQFWTRDLAPLQWCPFPQLVHAADEAMMQTERQAIAQQFGLIIGAERKKP